MKLYCDHCYKEFADLNYEPDYPLQIATIKKIYREHRTSDECRSVLTAPSFTRRRDASRDEDDLYFA